MHESRTQVAIVGAGPAGLLLGRLLHLAGVEAVILESRSRRYVESRIRAGVLERSTVEVLRQARVADRLEREGLWHTGFQLGFADRLVRIDLSEVGEGAAVTVYGQTKITEDLIEARLSRDGAPLQFEAEVTRVEGMHERTARVTYRSGGASHVLRADYVAGCDGFHGVCRAAIPASERSTFEKRYPFGWLGILSDTPPVSEELIYASHERGFALCSMRSPTRSRYYIQCNSDDRVERWTDDAFWDELRRRLPTKQAEALVTGPRLEMSIAPLRSFVSEPLRYGRLLLAGDAAHIVPPTGAKGLNLAVSDVHYLAEALTRGLKHGETRALEQYSDRCLQRVWNAVRFSWWFTSLMHRFEDDAIDRRLRRAELRYLSSSRWARRVLAENYVGLPL